MSAEPEVMQFLSPDGKPLTRFQAWQGFSATVGHWALRGFGLFAVIEKQSGDFVGRIGPWHPEGWPGLEVGWTIRSKYWGRGFATEAAAMAIEFAFSNLRQEKVISLITEANVRSIRVAERLGETRECTIALPHVPNATILQYRITKEEWRVLPRQSAR
jgi:RimJ/RimL family protein N-acetyltransferase